MLLLNWYPADTTHAVPAAANPMIEMLTGLLESTNDDIKEYSQIVYKKAKEHVTQKL